MKPSVSHCSMQPFCTLGSMTLAGVEPLDLEGIGWMDKAVFVLSCGILGKGFIRTKIVPWSVIVVKQDA